MIKRWLVIAVLIAAYFYLNGEHSTPWNNASIPAQSQRTDNADAVIAKAFANHTSNVQVAGEGIVVKLLPDDNSGSRHQKFIVKLANGQTLLVAHNIDLASRVSGLSDGDSVRFNGEYEWNPNGGVLHWTHRDPNGSHPAGWLQHDGNTYQ